VNAYAHLVCGHIVWVPETTERGDLVECWRCRVPAVLVERVSSSTRRPVPGIHVPESQACDPAGRPVPGSQSHGEPRSRVGKADGRGKGVRALSGRERRS
jgi:hypothetical protein